MTPLPMNPAVAAAWFNRGFAHQKDYQNFKVWGGKPPRLPEFDTDEESNAFFDGIDAAIADTAEIERLFDL